MAFWDSKVNFFCKSIMLLPSNLGKTSMFYGVKTRLNTVDYSD
jgi:hypothetical protein